MEENKKETQNAVEIQPVEPVLEETVVLEADKPYFEKLEKEKEKFVKNYNGSRLISLISTIVVVAIIIVSYTLIFPLEPNGQWLAVIIIIFALVGSMVFSRLLKKKITDVVKVYMSDYNGELNAIALETSNISNYGYDFKGEIPSEIFNEAKLLKDIINTTSRNLVKYDLDQVNVEIADFVAYRQEGKQARAAFLGKLVVAERPTRIDGRLLIHLKPDTTVFKDQVGGPDDLEGLVVIEENDKYVIYATSTEVSKAVSTKALEKLLEISPSKDLADVTLSIFENKVITTLTVSDTLMVVPYKEPVAGESILLYQKNLKVLNEFLTLLG